MVSARWSATMARCWAGMMVALTWSGSVRGEEPADAFLNALRDNGYYDVATVYLDRLDGSPLVSAQFQAELAYQRGVTLVQAASAARDRNSRERMLNEAKESLEKFLQEQPEHPKRVFARRQFSSLLRQWAAIKVEQAKRTNDAAMTQEAAKLYDDAHQALTQATSELRDALSKMKKEDDATADKEAIEYRDSLRGEYLLALLQGAESLEEKADTEPADSAARKTLLEQAATSYEDMYKKYREGGYLAGARARFYQARCLAKLGDYDQALKYLTDDLLSETDTRPAPRQLKTESLLLAMDAWMQESKKDYASVISQATAWLDTQRPAEEENPDWILLRLKLARAHKLYADQLAEKDPRDDQIKVSREAARKLARAVSRMPSDYQEEGRMLLAEIPGGVAAARIDAREPAQTFEEARTRGTDAISEMQSAQYFLDNVPERIERETDEKVKAELQQQLQTQQETMVLKRREAMDNLLLALSFAAADTPVEDLSLVRRLLAYLYYAEGEYYDAVVIGEFTGRRFPGSAGSCQAAQTALAAYLKLYEISSAETKDFETDHIVSLANYIVDTWSGTPEAAEAVNTLIPFLIRQGKLDKAREYVENIPPNSTERGSAELRIGEALWRDYLFGMNQLREWEKAAREGDADAAELHAKIAARKPQLAEVKKTAFEILESGVARMKEGGVVNATVPRAVLSLAQIYVDSDEAPKALQLLDDPQIGVLSMVARNDAAIDSPRLREQAYSVGLSAIVSALSKVKSTDQRTGLIQRSREMVQSLRSEVGDSAESQQRLVDIFYRLARGLETQLKLLDKPEDRRVLSEGFNTFLEQVRGEGKDLRVLNWVAESFSSLGNGLSDDANSAAAAHACFDNAARTYDQILENSEALGLTPELARQMRFRKALALRECSRYEEAAKILLEVLAQDNRRLEYQMEAARTYQLWGDQPQQALKYLDAVRGTGGEKNAAEQTIWGWSRLAQITQRSKQYRDAFHEARYGTAVCHYKLSLRLRQPADREKYLKLAKNDIVFTQRMFPNMGGQEWYTKYDALLKKVQRSLGERGDGLADASK